MKAAALPFMLSLALLAAWTNAWARDSVLPAGTLVQCTLDEPNFSSATARVGDPVLCHPHGLQVFGQALFPRGTYFVGHLADDQDPGHFWGKGYLRIEFDRIGLPSADLPLSAKMIAVNGYKVDKDGKIIGKGHAKRDIVEWLFPPLWPWKIITLPARGPRPTLKGETRVTLRLMDDVLVPASGQFQRFGQLADPGASYARPALYIRPKQLNPPSAISGAVYQSVSWQPPQAAESWQPQAATSGTQAAAQANDHSGWRSFRKSAAPAHAVAPADSPAMTDAAEADDDPAPAKTAAIDTNAAPADSAAVPVKAKASIEEQDIPPMNSQAPANAKAAIAGAPVNPSGTGDAAALVKTLTTENAQVSAGSAAPSQKPRLTLFALRAGTVYAVTDYWRDEDHLAYVLSNGKEGQIDMNELDWKTTTQLNTERNIKITLREGR